MGESGSSLFECGACKNMVVCLESVSHRPFMSCHRKVKHGMAEEVLEMSNTNMILVNQKSLHECVRAGLGDAKWC